MAVDGEERGGKFVWSECRREKVLVGGCLRDASRQIEIMT